MHRFPATPTVLLTLTILTGLAACGSGSDLGGSPTDGVPGSPSAPFEPAPPPAAWADDGCVACHGADGGGAGGGPNIQCTDYERLDTHLRPVTTSHAGGAFPGLSDNELHDLVAFLRTADCMGGDLANPPPPTDVPSTHTQSEDGVLHHPDYETNLTTCTTCHGANLEGTSFAPACTSCHGGDGFDDDDEPEREDD